MLKSRKERREIKNLATKVFDSRCKSFPTPQQSDLDKFFNMAIATKAAIDAGKIVNLTFANVSNLPIFQIIDIHPAKLIMLLKTQEEYGKPETTDYTVDTIYEMSERVRVQIVKYLAQKDNISLNSEAYKALDAKTPHEAAVFYDQDGPLTAYNRVIEKEVEVVKSTVQKVTEEGLTRKEIRQQMLEKIEKLLRHHSSKISPFEADTLQRFFELIQKEFK